VLLRDVLSHVGVDVDAIYNDTPDVQHVWPIAADCAPDGERYGVSKGCISNSGCGCEFAEVADRNGFDCAQLPDQANGSLCEGRPDQRLHVHLRAMGQRRLRCGCEWREGLAITAALVEVSDGVD
jgi:hypothetical protein